MDHRGERGTEDGGLATRESGATEKGKNLETKSQDG